MLWYTLIQKHTFVLMYTVYVLYSENSNKIYIGYTSNLLERIKSHNDLGKKGFTIRYRPWKVIYCEFFEEKDKALKREQELKSGKGREWIHKKIDETYKKHRIHIRLRRTAVQVRSSLHFKLSESGGFFYA